MGEPSVGYLVSNRVLRVILVLDQIAAEYDQPVIAHRPAAAIVMSEYRRRPGRGFLFAAEVNKRAAEDRERLHVYGQSRDGFANQGLHLVGQPILIDHMPYIFGAEFGGGGGHFAPFRGLPLCGLPSRPFKAIWMALSSLSRV